jgi:hypothetical protein
MSQQTENNPEHLAAAAIILEARTEVVARLSEGKIPLALFQRLPYFHQGLKEWPASCFPEQVRAHIYKAREQLCQLNLYATKTDNIKASAFPPATLTTVKKLAKKLGYFKFYYHVHATPKNFPDSFTSFDLFAAFLLPEDRRRFPEARAAFIQTLTEHLGQHAAKPFQENDIKKSVVAITGITSDEAYEALSTVLGLRPRYGIFETPNDKQLVERFIHHLKDKGYDNPQFFTWLFNELPDTSPLKRPGSVQLYLIKILGSLYHELIQAHPKAPSNLPKLIDPAKPMDVPTHYHPLEDTIQILQQSTRTGRIVAKAPEEKQPHRPRRGRKNPRNRREPK